MEFAHVTFGYGERHILKDFSMIVKQGEQVLSRIHICGGFESRILLQKIALQRVVKNMLGRFAF